MFTGIIKKTGIVKKIIFNKEEMQIGIKTNLKLSNKEARIIGSVSKRTGNDFQVELV